MCPLIPSYSKSDVETKKREILYQGVFRIVRYELQHRLFCGKWSACFSREVFERPSAAAILLYDPHKDCVVLIEQFRAGALSHPTHSPWLVEIVAGIFDRNETPEENIVREAKEEAGCKVTALISIAEYFVSPGGTNEYLYLFCGKVDASDSSTLHGLTDEQEDIRTIILPAQVAFDLVAAKEIHTSPTLLALQWLQLNHERIKTLWQTD